MICFIGWKLLSAWRLGPRNFLSFIYFHLLPFFNIHWSFWVWYQNLSISGSTSTFVGSCFFVLNLSKVCYKSSLVVFKHLFLLSFVQLLFVQMLLTLLTSASGLFLPRWYVVLWEGLVTCCQMCGCLFKLILLFSGQRLHIQFMKQICAILQKWRQSVLFKLDQALCHSVFGVQVLSPLIISFPHMIAEFLDTLK